MTHDNKRVAIFTVPQFLQNLYFNLHTSFTHSITECLQNYHTSISLYMFLLEFIENPLASYQHHDRTLGDLLELYHTPYLRITLPSLTHENNESSQNMASVISCTNITSTLLDSIPFTGNTDDTINSNQSVEDPSSLARNTTINIPDMNSSLLHQLTPNIYDSISGNSLQDGSVIKCIQIFEKKVAHTSETLLDTALSPISTSNQEYVTLFHPLRGQSPTEIREIVWNPINITLSTEMLSNIQACGLTYCLYHMQYGVIIPTSLHDLARELYIMKLRIYQLELEYHIAHTKLRYLELIPPTINEKHQRGLIIERFGQYYGCFKALLAKYLSNQNAIELIKNEFFTPLWYSPIILPVSTPFFECISTPIEEFSMKSTTPTQPFLDTIAKTIVNDDSSASPLRMMSQITVPLPVPYVPPSNPPTIDNIINITPPQQLSTTSRTEGTSANLSPHRSLVDHLPFISRSICEDQIKLNDMQPLEHFFDSNHQNIRRNGHNPLHNTTYAGNYSFAIQSVTIDDIMQHNKPYDAEKYKSQFFSHDNLSNENQVPNSRSIPQPHFSPHQHQKEYIPKPYMYNLWRFFSKEQILNQLHLYYNELQQAATASNDNADIINSSTNLQQFRDQLDPTNDIIYHVYYNNNIYDNSPHNIVKTRVLLHTIEEKAAFLHALTQRLCPYNTICTLQLQFNEIVPVTSDNDDI